jgi:ABC-type lipoprotein export system ATPase subunit
MVTHDPRFAEHAKRIIHLLDGKIVDGATARRAHDEPVFQAQKVSATPA